MKINVVNVKIMSLKSILVKKS